MKMDVVYTILDYFTCSSSIYIFIQKRTFTLTPTDNVPLFYFFILKLKYFFKKSFKKIF